MAECLKVELDAPAGFVGDGKVAVLDNQGLANEVLAR